MQKTIDDAKKDATAVAKAEAESYVNQFKDQMQRRSAIATQYEKRIRELEATTKATKKKMKQLQQRRTMDLEGFTADVTTLRRLLAAYSTHRDLITIGAYKAGSDPDTDEALARWSRIEAFLRQDTREAADLDSARHALQAIFEDKGTS